MATKKWCVTGSNGFIGSNLVKALLARGDRVVCLDDDSRGSHKRLADVCNKLESMHFGDVCNIATTIQAVRGCDAVVHLAAVNGTRHFYERPGRVLEVAAKGILNVMDACIYEGVKEFYAASSSEVYQAAWKVPTPEDVALVVPDPYNPRYSYGAGKILTEMMALHYHPEHFTRVVLFRPHNVYGPDSGEEHVIPQFVRRMLAMHASQPDGEIRFPVQGDGHESRAFCYVDDAVSGILTAIDGGEHRETYNVGTDWETPVHHLAEMVGAVVGRTVRVEPGPLCPGSVARRCPDVGKLKALGWHPKVGLREGLEKTIEWYRANPKVSS